MKRIYFVLVLVSLMAVGCTSEVATTSEASVGEACSQKIVYVNMDSLTQSYMMYQDLRNEYEQSVRGSETEINGIATKLDKDINEFREKVQKGLVTRATAASMEESLTKRQQQFMLLRENTVNELAKQEVEMTGRIHKSITDYLKEFNKDFRYAMILVTTGGTPILNADPQYDITRDVVAGLNAVYSKK